ncbi:MAG: hypothetical protein GY797_03390 [Deltaproteobacteria bacterium]|nr:hypothetical protein [Deltaproteobacteria bacterium]
MANNSLKIYFTVPFDDQSSSQSIVFSQWIPDNESDILIKQYEGVTVSISFDIKCVSSLGDVTKEEISCSNTNYISKLYAVADLGKIDNELTSFIFDERDSATGKHHGILPEDKRYEYFNNEYKCLGETVIKAVNDTCNRLIEYARNNKRQYWLTALNKDNNNLLNRNNSWRAKASINDGDKFRWVPPGTNVILFESMIPFESSIKKSEWNDVKLYLGSTCRSPLVFELISNARYLLGEGHRRSAVLEIVSALEVATTTFFKSPNVTVLNTQEYASRIDLNNLGNQSSHLGFSGSIRYLVPLLFSRDYISDATLEKCYQAIDVRNNVVHKGQRSVGKELAREIINACDVCCTALDQYTIKGT